jgi:hypothetical protein
MEQCEDRLLPSSLATQALDLAVHSRPNPDFDSNRIPLDAPSRSFEQETFAVLPSGLIAGMEFRTVAIGLRGNSSSDGLGFGGRMFGGFSSYSEESNFSVPGGRLLLQTDTAVISLGSLEIRISTTTVQFEPLSSNAVDYLNVGNYNTGPIPVDTPDVASPSAELAMRSAVVGTTEPSELPTLPTETFAPIEVSIPPAVARLFGLDEQELDTRISQILSDISNLGEEWTLGLERAEPIAWLVTAGLLTAGAGYTLWVNQKRRPMIRFPLSRGTMTPWESEEHDARNQ